MCKKKNLGIFQKSIIRHAHMRDFTTLKIGGKATILCPRNINEFVDVLEKLERQNLRYKVIGNGSNLLIDSKSHKTIFVCTRNVREFEISKNRVFATAGTNINELILFCQKNQLSGLENLFSIPATIGGMIAMNAGSFGSCIFDHLVEIKAFDGQKVVSILPSSVERENHWTELLGKNVTILSAVFELESKSSSEIATTIRNVLKKREKNQPKGNSAGCVFANPENESAGKLIDQAGLKGLRVGNAFVSEKHANFIISKNAKSKHVLKLIKLIQKKVLEKFNVKLKTEIEYIGEDYENYR